MKIYVSADIEGVTGTTHWDEAESRKPDYAGPREQMTAEAAAACRGAKAAGATEIWVRDAHGDCRNLIASKLPQEARLIRGWSGHPFGMVEFLDESFDAVALVGYHSHAGSPANPLSHTLTGKPYRMTINDVPASESLLSIYAAATVGVPVVFVSGDEGLCEDVLSLNGNITTVGVKRGSGASTVNIHPELATKLIEDGVAKAVAGDVRACLVGLPTHFTTDILYRKHEWAYAFSFYPGATLTDPFTVRFETDDFFEVLRLLAFTV